MAGTRPGSDLWQGAQLADSTSSGSSWRDAVLRMSTQREILPASEKFYVRVIYFFWQRLLFMKVIPSLGHGQ